MTAVHELASYEKTDRWSLAAPVARSCWVGWKRSAEIGPRRDPQKSECAWLRQLGWWQLGGGGGILCMRLSHLHAHAHAHAHVHVHAHVWDVRVRCVLCAWHAYGCALMVMRFFVPRW